MEAIQPEIRQTRILVAEDSPTQSQIIRSVLMREGYDVIVAGDGIEAVSLAFREIPDLLILDIDMPKMNGYQVCRLIKHDYRTSHIPVVMLTGRDQETDKFWGLKTGADRYVTKGFQLSGLSDTVRELQADIDLRPRHEEHHTGSHDGNGQQELDVLSRVNDLLDRKLFEATVINEISKLNTISEDSGVTIGSVLSVIAKVTDCYVGTVLLLEEAEMVIEVNKPVGKVFFEETQKRAIDAARPFLLPGMSVKQLRFVTDADPGFIEGEKGECGEVRSILTMPLNARGRPIGVMTLTSPRRDAFNDEVRDTMELIENPASVVVDNARLHDGTRRLAITDGLTRLINHRHFYELLENEFLRTNRYMSQMALIMLDIDFFKQVNDTYGHPVGDDILKEISEVISWEVREVDVIARYGGEEFAVLLPQTDVGMARSVAERVRAAVEDHTFRTPEGEIRITVSLGVVGFPECPVENQMELVRLADEALYEAKNTGRNRVIAARYDDAG